MSEWLKTLEMEEYTELFHRCGYKTDADVENLKRVDERELERMGIVKTGIETVGKCVEFVILQIAHVQRLKSAIERLFHPTSGMDQCMYC